MYDLLVERVGQRENRDQDVLEMSIQVGGGDLSLGQRQLICLLRALLKVSFGLRGETEFCSDNSPQEGANVYSRSQVLCVDEATASVDEATEHALHAALSRLSDEFSAPCVLTPKLTCLFIAHRVGALVNMCDRILVLRRGRVVECGTPGELLASGNSHFARLVKQSRRSAPS